MVERMDDMPQGVVGLRASGKLTKEDYTGVLEPALKEAMDAGEARVVFVIDDYEGIQPSAAVAMHAFAWAMPGELAVYGMDELDEAKGWAAG
jgi:hypothetical protein